LRQPHSSRFIAVGIETRLQAGRVGVWIAAGATGFSLLQNYHFGCGPMQPPFQWVSQIFLRSKAAVQWIWLITSKVKEKLSHYRSGQDIMAAGVGGSQNFEVVGTWKYLCCQPYASAAFTSQDVHLVLISVGSWLDPKVIVRRINILTPEFYI